MERDQGTDDRLRRWLDPLVVLVALLLGLAVARLSREVWLGVLVAVGYYAIRIRLR